MQLKCISEAHNCIILYCLHPRIPESIGDILTSCWLFWEASWKAGIKTPPGGLSGACKRSPTSLLHPTFDLRNPHGFSLLLIPLEEITSDRLSPSVSGMCVLSETGFRFTLSEAWRKFWFFPYLQREQGAHWPA